MKKPSNQLSLRFSLPKPAAPEPSRWVAVSPSHDNDEDEPASPHAHYTVSDMLDRSPLRDLPLATARVAFREKLNDGTTCPCCGRYARRYRRSINATMAGALAVLVQARQAGSAWMRAEEVGNALKRFPAFTKVSYPHGEIGKLAFPAWGLVEAKPNTDSPHKKHSGMWRATARGEAFVMGNLAVPRYLWVYDNHVDAVSTEVVNVRECFKGSFSYLELMRSPPTTGGAP